MGLYSRIYIFTQFFGEVEPPTPPHRTERRSRLAAPSSRVYTTYSARRVHGTSRYDKERPPHTGTISQQPGRHLLGAQRGGGVACRTVTGCRKYRRTACEDQRPAWPSCSSVMPTAAPCEAPPMRKQWPERRATSSPATRSARRSTEVSARHVMGRRSSPMNRASSEVQAHAHADIPLLL